MSELAARASTWWAIFKINFHEKLVYRGDFMLGTLMRFLPIVTQVFLWYAVFGSIRAHMSGDGDQAKIAGYTYDNIVAYYLLSTISRAFSSMPGLASGIALQIREGEIKKYLIQPLDLISFMFLNRLAHKLTYYIVAAAPFALVFWLCRDFFSGWPPPHILAAFFASLLMSFALGFFLEATIGMIGFWFLEVSSLLFVYMLFNFFLSGHMFPLDMLDNVSGPWGMIVRGLPLMYLAYFPAAVFLGKIQGTELVIGLVVQLAWVIFFYVTCRLSLYYGVKRYSGYGG
ncbi:ABC-2 family transporter protein [Blastopirellula sp. JC732]|uniref:ABC-2 family transporter protein n=1 Tax=Blastopirellula sediminis TaxID=2894196 RepID=A0A9X1SHD9_9BACT|nr:ABC-2 family transporter protein [Blastopirellula sediminis]MCC9605595.1 ABC-2 family transporter protein [Blastopirellula sediminis]MCC9631105.1 ABC-2 family transporter protein [Blastopirellula sediminis]